MIEGATVAKINSLIAKANATGECIATWEEIQEVLVLNQLAYRSKVAPEFCGVHSKNRTLHHTHTPTPTIAACRLYS